MDQLCRLLEISRSGYYAWLHRGISPSGVFHAFPSFFIMIQPFTVLCSFLYIDQKVEEVTARTL